MIEKFYKYIDDVKSGKQITGKYARLAVERHLRDLERSKENNFPYFFCEDTAKRVLGFVHMLKHTKGKWVSEGLTIDWQPFQCFMFACTLAWLKKSDKLRRFNTAYNKMARKGGKTTYAAAVASYLLIADGEHGAEVYWAATKRDQAKIGWSIQKAMTEKLIRDSSYIRKHWKVNSQRIYSDSLGSFVDKLGKDSKREDGLNPHVAIIDEYHAHPDDGIVNVLETGMGSRQQPMLLYITTAGFNKYGVCYNYEKVCKDILEGKIENDRTFAICFDLDEGDEWDNSEVWIKSNPALGETPTFEYMQSMCNKAKTEGSTKLVEFKTKNLNQWTDTEDVWIKDEDWKANGGEIDEETLKGRKCYVGMDLASIRDLTSVKLVFPPIEKGEPFKVIKRFFAPEDNIRERSKTDRIPYLNWVDQGHIILTAGNVTDYDYVYNEFENLANKYEIVSIAYDKWNAVELATRMELAGFNMKAFPQTTTYFNEPLKEIEKLIAKKQLNHGKCPVLRWMNGNVHIWRDGNGNMKILKKDNIKKVDGMVALAMAVGEYLHYKDETSIYETEARKDGFLAW